MSRNIRGGFFLLVMLQALHSFEEFLFNFYERFPPMRFAYQNRAQLAKPAFVIFNLLLISIGLICFCCWVWPQRKGAILVVWIWIIMESLNVVAHVVWAALIGAYNPGLVTGLLFVPVLSFLCYSIRGLSRSPKMNESINA